MEQLKQGLREWSSDTPKELELNRFFFAVVETISGRIEMVGGRHQGNSITIVHGRFYYDWYRIHAWEYADVIMAPFLAQKLQDSLNVSE